jgi:hypothetical protein
MTNLRAAIASAALLCSGSALIQAHASEVLTIPYSSALATVDASNSCLNNYPYHWQTGTNGCALMFPLNIPVGHVVHQISVLRSTDTAPAPAPFFEVTLSVSDLVAVATQERFVWSSNDYVAAGTIENRKIMRQTKIAYPDEFSVAPNTNYQVYVLMSEGAYVFAVQVVYD